MKSLISLWSCVAHEMATRCCTSATRDVKTVTRRYEHEGLSFLAITLADLGKAIQKWLDQGFVAPWECPSFKTDPLTGLPRFLGGFLERVFDPSSGTLLDKPCIESIYALRQLTLMFSKIALPESSLSGSPRRVVSPDRERRAMLDYVQCEQDVKTADDLLDPQYLEDFKRMSAMLFSEVFDKVDRDIYWARLRGKHGPGAVADKLSSNGKWNQRTWTARLQKVFPAEEFLIPNANYRKALESEIDILEPGSEIPVRVITVPKTLKTPRIIAIEPAAMQFAQQALLRGFLDAFRESNFLSTIVGFDDQDPNREMARSGSLSGELATLDMSEASDRVSNRHVRAMFEDWPLLMEAIQATRSRKADVPGHGVIRLAKYASMGSALCFPVEAMVFTTLIFLGIERELSVPLSPRTLHAFKGKVRVFGDDLIVPRDSVLSVVDELSTFGYKVNASKSFWTGRFRESCGREYYDGHDVSIVKVRRTFPTQRQDAAGVISLVSLRNQLYWAGLWQSVRMLDETLRGILRYFPNVLPTSPVLGRESALGFDEFGPSQNNARTRHRQEELVTPSGTLRLDPNYHSPLVKGYRVVAKPPIDKLDGVGALLKCLSSLPWEDKRFAYPSDRVGNIGDAKADAEHLERSGRPEHVSIKLGWGSPF